MNLPRLAPWLEQLEQRIRQQQSGRLGPLEAVAFLDCLEEGEFSELFYHLAVLGPDERHGPMARWEPMMLALIDGAAYGERTQVEPMLRHLAQNSEVPEVSARAQGVLGRWQS